MAQIHISTDVQWITRVVRTVLFWMLVFPLAAFILGGMWCLIAVGLFQALVIGLIWWAVRR
ncbi:hypothetical protein GCM10022223_47130 [Kineosporia mesophila]|uniref:Uncharacterized protein n=1 Tax=Kineosporia mesophila TaxID=566012 RepID=A0ABP7A467_9ACTN|nr:hypothetical protein [Kineosporia mesophila]MCD5353821.1 hypothetical protein [Kineosporia mesophila]